MEVVRVEMQRGEAVPPGSHERRSFTGHAFAGGIIGAVIVGILFSLT